MKNSPACVITGCELISSRLGTKVHGDLHQLGDTWIFNACLNDNGEAAWDHSVTIDKSCKALILDGDFFERRGVIIAATAAAILNDAALEYLS